MIKFLAITFIGIVFGGVAPGQNTCYKACLEGFIDRYLDALVAHDPKLVPLARSVKFTENGQRLEPGDGFWRTMTAKGTYRLFVTDTLTGEVAFIPANLRDRDVDRAPRARRAGI
jgi:hypothetical protein